MGRPSVYSLELVESICNTIATSTKGLKRICDENKEFPSYVTMFHWLNDPDKVEFLNQYARAREAQAELLADEIIEIADDLSEDEISKDGKVYTDHENINRSRLRVDARKWKASKLAPKKYGDKLDLTTGGDKITDRRQMKLPDGTLIDL